MASARPVTGASPHPVTGGLGRRDLLLVIGAFLVFALGFGAVLAALQVAEGLSGEEVVWSRRVAPPARPPAAAPRPRDFEIAGVRFGTTADDLARRQPGTRFNTGRSGKTVGSFRRDGGAFTVGFLPPALGGGAYEVRYEQTFVSHDEDAVLARLGQRFGWPANSTCNRRNVAVAGRACTFRWFPAGAVEIEAHIRPAFGRDAAAAGTALMLIARDTVATDRLGRADATGALDLSPLGRLLEKLPF